MPLPAPRFLQQCESEWANWNKFAHDGAEAARANNERAAEAQCGYCHRVYRREYNARYRERKLPE